MLLKQQDGEQPHIKEFELLIKRLHTGEHLMLADKRLQPHGEKTPNEKTFASSIKNSLSCAEWTSTSAVQNTNAHKFGRCFFQKSERSEFAIS